MELPVLPLPAPTSILPRNGGGRKGLNYTLPLSYG